MCNNLNMIKNDNNLNGDKTMKYKTFKSRVTSKWMVGYTKRKIINHARKHNLEDYLKEMINDLGHYLSPEELSEFVKPDDRTAGRIKSGRLEWCKK